MAMMSSEAAPAYGVAGEEAAAEPREAAVQVLNTIIQLHFEKALEKKAAVDAQKKELWRHFQLFFLFLALLLGAEAGGSRLQCRHCWAPIALLSLATLLFYVAVAHSLRALNGFKYQRRCHKLTLALATDRLRHLKALGPQAANENLEDVQIRYQEPPESYLVKFKRSWALHFGFLILVFGFMVAASLVILCF